MVSLSLSDSFPNLPVGYCQEVE